MWHSKELQNFESSFIQVNKDSEFYDVLRELENLKHYHLCEQEFDDISAAVFQDLCPIFLRRHETVA